MAITILSLISIYIMTREFPNLVRKEPKKVIILYLCLVSTGIGLGVTISMHLKVLNPSDLVIYLFNPLKESIYHLF